MQLRVNLYDFQANSTFIGTRAKIRRAKNGIPYALENEIDVRGELLTTTIGASDLAGQQELTGLENALREALKSKNLDVTFFRNDNQPSSISVRSIDTIGGVQILDGPHFPGDTGDEYAIKRRFEFKLGFLTQFDPTQENFVVEFSERTMRSGGGPFFKFKRAANGPPQKHRIYEQVEYQLVQAGEIVGFSDYIDPPAALFPSDQTESPDIQHLGSERLGDSNINFRISYKYTMAASRPIGAFPNRWVNV